ncbi:MAG: hypothetical protein ACFFA3_18495 [Promethearchaeota archaeon]
MKITDGIEFDEEKLIGVVKTYIIENLNEKHPNDDKVSLFNKMERIVFMPLGEHNHQLKSKGKGYGLLHFFHGISRDDLIKWGLKDPRSFADFLLETMDNPDGNPDKFGLQVKGGYPIYRVRINNTLRYIRVIISQKGAVINAYKSNKGSEYFNSFDPNKAHIYKIKSNLR